MIHTAAKRVTAWLLGLAVIVSLGVATIVPASAAETDSTCEFGTNTIAQCFPDTALANKIAQQLNAQTTTVLTQDMAQSVTALNLGGYDIANLQGLQLLTNLKQLTLNQNQVSDLTPLKGLTNLTHLELNVNQVSDISPLKGLTNLTYLDLSGNQVSEITPLKDLTKLTYLSFYGNQVSDISPVKGLTNLNNLTFAGNQVSDISPVKGLTNLTDLFFADNKVSDISPLKDLTKLTNLYFYDNQVSDISSLKDLTNLARIQAYDQRVVLPASSNTTVSIPTATDRQGAPVAPASVDPSDGVYDSATGQAVWTNVQPGTTLKLTWDQSPTQDPFYYSGTISRDVVAGYNVAFDANQGAGSMDGQRVRQGDALSLPANTFTRAGYSFTGWNTKADGTGTAYADKDTLTPTGDMTLYAQWKQDAVQRFTVTFDSRGGSAVNPATVDTGRPVAKPADPTRSGYTFKGWAGSRDTTTLYDFTTPVTANMTLYAQWEKTETGGTTPSTPGTPDASKPGTPQSPNVKPKTIGTGKSLATTGSAVMGLGTLALILLAAGVALVAYRRNGHEN